MEIKVVLMPDGKVKIGDAIEVDAKKVMLSDILRIIAYGLGVRNVVKEIKDKGSLAFNLSVTKV